MKKAKYMFYGILLMLAVLLIMAIFLPKEYNISIDKKLEVSTAVVYGLLSDMDNRSQWDPIVRKLGVSLDNDNDSKRFGWSSQDYGATSLEIKSLKKDVSVVLEEFREDTEVPSVIEYTLKESDIGKGTNTSIIYTGSTNWPRNLFNIIIKRKQFNRLSAQLDELEIIAKDREVSQIYNGYKIVEEIVRERNFVLKRDEVSASAIQQFYVQNLGVLFQSVQDAGTEMDGMPCGLFFTQDMKSETIDMAAAIPVIDEVNIPGAESLNIKTRTAIVVDYYGDYNRTNLAHNAVNAYMVDQGYVVDIPIIEEYVTDPGSEKDPNKWLTKITYYIKGK